MPTAFRLKTLPEILAQMFATARALLGMDADLVPGSILRTSLEAAALQDADQYIQIGKLLDLFSVYKAKGDDLDRRAEDYGSQVFEAMRRRAALKSIGSVIVGDGTVQAQARLLSSHVAGTLTFDVDDGSAWPVSGGMVIEQGTPREEDISYTRVSDTFTVIAPATGFINPHLIAGRVKTMSTTSVLNAAITAGAATADLVPGTESPWPVSGVVILERSTVRREALPFTRAGVTLTFTGVTTFAHAISTALILSTFGSDRTVSIGAQPYVPETFASARISYVTTEAGSLLDGDYTTAPITVESEDAGAGTLAGANTITVWQSEPFATATVTNAIATTRGRDREDDDIYTDRLVAFRQSLSRGTALSIETLLSGTVDPFTEAIIAFVQVVEPVSPGLSLAYITDGSTTFSIDYQTKTGRTTLISVADLNDARTRVPDYGPFKKALSPPAVRTPRLYRSTERGESNLVGANFIEDSTKSWVVGSFVGMFVKTDDDQFYEITANTAIRLTVAALAATPSIGAYAILDFSVDPLIPDTDYLFNTSNGDLELTTPLLQYDALVAADDGASGSVGAYSYCRGLAAHAQRLINGDRTDPDAYPGIRSTGSQVLLAAPTVVSPTIMLQVLTASGVPEADVTSTVQSVVQSYVNTLSMGSNILLAEIIRRVKGTSGVTDVKVLSPSANVPVSDGQLARINDSNVQVL